MGEALAVLAALLFAAGTVLQQRGTLSTAAAEDDPRFLLQILHRPVWLAGAAFRSSGWVVQAMALDRASLVVVQSLTAFSLVIALPLGVALTGQHVGRREAAGTTLTLLGIVVSGEAMSGAGASHTGWTVVGLLAAIVGIALLAGSGSSSCRCEVRRRGRRISGANPGSVRR